MEEGKLSHGTMIAITVLRVLVGWHFLYEGIAKLTSASFTSAGYLKQARGPFSGLFHWMAADPNWLNFANQGTMWGLTIIGILLILGLFTRLASLGGIVFLLMFYFATPPFIGYFYALPSEGSYLLVNKNLVELGALIVVLVSGSGIYAGLDRFVHVLLTRRSRSTTAPASR